MVSGSRKENIAINQIQIGQVETKGKRHDKEAKSRPHPSSSPTRKPKEPTYISVLKQSNGSAIEQVPIPSTTTSCEVLSRSNKSRRTSVSSITLDGIVQHGSSSEHRVVDQRKSPSNDAFDRVSETDDNSHLTYKSETDVQLKITGRRGNNLSSSITDKSPGNERCVTSHLEEDTINDVESGASEENSVKETFTRSFQTETYSSVTREYYTINQRFHSNKQVANGRSESYTSIESKTRLESLQNEKHQINRKPGSFVSDVSESLQGEKLSPQLSSCTISNDQKASLDRSPASNATVTTKATQQSIKTSQNNSLLTESSNNSIQNNQKPNKERHLDIQHKQIIDNSKNSKRGSGERLGKELDSTGTSGKETRHRLSRKDQLRVAMDWQHKLQLQVETLSWKYKSLEVEYNFLEKLIAEQREDLSKAKDWAKHAKETPTRVESLTYCL